jgi:hypothetical protein
MKSYKLIGLSIIFLFIISGTPIKKNKKTYYPSGKLHSSGWYINDTIPVGEYSEYFKNGKLAWRTHYNDSGQIDGLNERYFKNGSLCESAIFVSGKCQGFDYRYYENGKLKSKVFAINSRQIGDSYYFYKNGNKYRYNFYDFRDTNDIDIKWDSIGNLVTHQRHYIMIDSIKLTKDSTGQECAFICNLMMLVSNPPYCRTTVNIQYLSQNNNLMKSDTVIGIPYYCSKNSFMDSLTRIKIFSREYDSITNKSVHSEDTIDIYDPQSLIEN